MLRNIRAKFLEGLTPSQHESVVAAAKHVRSPANSVITNEGRPAERLFLLLTGRARYFVLSRKHRKVILLWIPPGEVFGTSALVTPPISYLVSAETVSDSSMLVWGRGTIQRLAKQYPRLLANALSESVTYLAAYRAAHLALVSDTGGERLAHVLISLASGIGQQVAGGIELNVGNQELANEANITLFEVSRVLTEWQRSGMVRKGRGKILLRSPKLLLRHATTGLTA